MNLKDIGFYTLSDDRVKAASVSSPLQRCELILTDACNFRCGYCRGLRSDIAGTIQRDQAMRVLEYWVSQGLVNVRFSGGEPTLHKHLSDFVAFCKSSNVKRIAVSSNGSMLQDKYEELLAAGVNDFSISLDACCASTGDMMAGVKGYYDRVLENIAFLSSKSYTTVGIVLTEQNEKEVSETIKLAASLGVSDIRVIPAAQVSRRLIGLNIGEEILNRYPVLRYRYNNIKAGLPVRGIGANDSNRCAIVLDDMAVVQGYHFPCVIYMREQGDAIGKIGPTTRQDRENWSLTHDTHKDPICSANCLDVCIEYNNIRYKL